MTGPARVLNLLHAAHPDDVPAVLHLLTDAEIAAGLASDLCDPELRSAAADRAALTRALLDPRPATTGLLTEPGRCQAAVRLASRTPYQRMLPGGVTPFGRAQADLNLLIHTRLTNALGDSWRAWHGVLTRTDMWEASFEALLAEARTWGPHPPDSQLAIHFRTRENLFLPGVLLAMAPPAVVVSVLAYTGPRSQDLCEGLLKHAPYHPAYLEHVLGPDGTSHSRQCLALNTTMPLAAAHDFLDRTTDPGVPHLVARANSDLPLRLHAVGVMTSAPAADIPWSPSGVGKTTVSQIHALLLAAAETADNADELVHLMHRFRPVLTRSHHSGPELRLLAYAMLARVAGPEAVWAVELDYAHRLEDMLPVVRASMAANSAAPLYAAAAQIVPPEPPPLPPVQIPLADWPLEDAVRAHLDHRPERWRALMGLAAVDPAPVVELVHRLGRESVRQTVRPAGRRIEDLKRTAGLQTGPDPAQEGDTA